MIDPLVTTGCNHNHKRACSSCTGEPEETKAMKKDFKFLKWCAEHEKKVQERRAKGQNVANYDLLKGKVRNVKPI